MTLAVWFWVLMLLWLLFGVWYAWPDPTQRLGRFGGMLLPFFLLLLLGWKVFGSPIAGG